MFEEEWIETEKIETERLTLREMREEDARDVYDVLTDKGVARWLGIKPVHSVDEAWAFMERFIDSPFFEIYAITLKGEDKVIGFIQVAHHWDRTYAFGYCLHSAYRGKGYMTEAVKTLISYFFEERTWLRAIQIDVFDGNEASASVARKCGLFYDSTSLNILSRYGNVEDENHYSITIGDYEWAHRQSA